MQSSNPLSQEERFTILSGETFAIRGDNDYLRDMGEEFEPDTVALFAQLCAKDGRVLILARGCFMRFGLVFLPAF